MDPEETDGEFEDQTFDELDEQDEDALEEETSDEELIEEEPQPRKPSRAQARIEALDRQVREANERAEAAERLAREIQNGNSRAEAERRERERTANMDPDELRDYQARQRDEQLKSELGSLRQQVEDSTDRAEFAAACAANPALAKVKDDVEKQLRDARSRGVDVPRQTLAAYILGQQILDKAPKARARAERRAAANLDRERSRPASGSSDAPRQPTRDEKTARDKRLEGYVF